MIQRLKNWHTAAVGEGQVSIPAGAESNDQGMLCWLSELFLGLTLADETLNDPVKQTENKLWSCEDSF